MQNTRDPISVMQCLVHTGLEASDWRQRQATALFLSLPSTPLDNTGQMHRDLVRALCGLFTDSIDQVAQSGKQALARVRLTIGEGDFSACVRALPPPLRSAYENAESGEGASEAADPSSLEYGFVSQRLMGALREVGNWQVRAQAIAELQTLLAALSDEMVPRVAPHLASFTDLLTTFLEDTNFKISLTSLQMISDLLDRFSEHIRNGPDSQAIFLAIVPRLMDKFADNKIVIRQANFRLTKKLMAIVPPERALPSLLGYAQHANSHIREQAISVLIQTLLSAPRQPLELYRAALQALSNPLADAKPKVRTAALEAAAVIHEVAGAAAFETLLRDLELGDDKEDKITERIRLGKSAMPTLSSDGLVEFTTQPGLAGPGGNPLAPMPVRAPSAGSQARVPSAGRARLDPSAIISISASAAAQQNAGLGGPSNSSQPPTPEEPTPPGSLPPAPAPDFSDLMEFTAGGRRIATSKGRLPWDKAVPKREGVASRGRPAAAQPPLLEDAGEHELPPDRPSSLSAREPRTSASAMRIEVPQQSMAAGPLSAPPQVVHGNGNSTPGVDDDTGTFLTGGEISSNGNGGYDQLGQKKTALWLPERSGAEAPGAEAPSARPVVPLPSRHRSAGANNPGAGGGNGPMLGLPGGLPGGGPVISGGPLTGSFDGGSGPRDSLKLLKRRQNPLAQSDSGVGGLESLSGMSANGTPMPPMCAPTVSSCCSGAGSSVAQRATTANRAPQVRLPFDAPVQRSSSAPHKRTDGAGSGQTAESRLEEAVGQMAAGPSAAHDASSNGSETPNSIRLGADFTGNDSSTHTGPQAYPSRRSTNLNRARFGASGGIAGVVDSKAEAPSAAPFGRGGVRRSGELNLQLDGIGVSRTTTNSSTTSSVAGTAVEEEGSSSSSADRMRKSGGKGNLDELREVTQGGGLKVLEELRTEELKALPAPPPEQTLRSLLEQLRSDDWSAHFDAINLLRRLVAWADEAGSDGGLIGQLHSINLLLIGYADSLRSALAKNAVVCFRELFSYIGNKMEADLDLIVPVLIKKAGESNGFICDEANKALSAMVHNVSESRAIAALLSSASHRNPAARAKAAAHLAKALELMGYARLLHVRRFTTPHNIHTLHTTLIPSLPSVCACTVARARARSARVTNPPLRGPLRDAREREADHLWPHKRGADQPGRVRTARALTSQESLRARVSEDS